MVTWVSRRLSMYRPCHQASEERRSSHRGNIFHIVHVSRGPSVRTRGDTLSAFSRTTLMWPFTTTCGRVSASRLLAMETDAACSCAACRRMNSAVYWDTKSGRYASRTLDLCWATSRPYLRSFGRAGTHSLSRPGVLWNVIGQR